MTPAGCSEACKRGAVEDRAAARGQVVDDSLGLELRLELEFLGEEPCQRADGADSDLPVWLPVCLGRLQGAAQHLERVDRGGERVFPCAAREGLGIGAPARPRRRLAIADAGAETSVGLGRLGCVLGLTVGFANSPTVFFRILGVRPEGEGTLVEVLANGVPGQIVLVRESGRLKVLRLNGS